MGHNRVGIICTVKERRAGRIYGERVPVTIGEVGGEVSDERVEGPRTEELYSMLPLVGANEFGVGDDLYGCRFETFIQLLKSELLAFFEHVMKLIQVGGRLRDLTDIVVESVRVLDG